MTHDTTGRTNQPEPPLADTLPAGVTTATLENGLQVVIQEDHRTPLAICHAWLRVGSNWEPGHLRGWAHGIEHMLFKGTARRGENDFAREVAEAGGTTNAGTGYETTSYHILVPREHVHRACDILADALFSAVFAPGSLDPERQVLVHENHMYDDIPYGYGIGWRLGMLEAFRRSPYRHAIGGEDERLLAASREQILAFYRSAYRPGNTAVVVVGDVAPDEALAMVADTFGRAPARASELPVPPIEPVQEELRFRRDSGDLEKTYAKLIFHAPAEGHPDRPVLSVLERILGDGRSARLHREILERQQLVSDISLLDEIGPREGVIVVDLETNSEQLPRALQATAAQLELLKQENPSPDEMDRARRRVQRSFHFQQETVQGRSSTIGHAAAMGDLARAFDYPARVARVTAEEVSRLARHLFRRGNLTLHVYGPATGDPAALPTAPATGPHDRQQAEELLAASLSSAPAENRPTGPSGRRPPVARGEGKTGGPTSAAAGFQESTLGNGLRLAIRRDPAVPTVCCQILAPGGCCREAPGQAGLASLLQRVQIKGTVSLDAQALHERIEGLGASLSPQVGRDATGLVLTALSDRLDPALTILGEVATAPALSAQELTRERRLALEQLQALEDDPFQHAGRELRRLVYGEHPYGQPLQGTPASLAARRREDLVRHHADTWTPDNLLVVASGDVDPDRLATRLEQILAGVPAGPAPALAVPPPVLPPAAVVQRRIARRTHQCVLLQAWPGPADANENRVPLMLLLELMNGQSGRLFSALRNQRALCYNSGMTATAGFGQGMLVAFVLTDPAREGEAETALLAELTRIAAQTAPPAEFSRARAKLLGNLLIAHQGNSARVGRCAQDLLYGRSSNDLEPLLAEIGRCEAEEVRAVAARYLDPEHRFQVVLGPEG
jgi:zinc protease